MESGQDRRVYVGNLAYDVRWQQLKDFMRQAGEVVHADILSQANGQSRGCAIVEYATPEEAANAVETLNMETIKGRQVYIREDREAVGATNHSLTRGGLPNAVFVGNLPFSVSWQDLKDRFRQAGNVVRADVHANLSGRSRGRGTVVFDSPEAVQNAITLFNGFVLEGRSLEVREDLPPTERPSRASQDQEPAAPAAVAGTVAGTVPVAANSPAEFRARQMSQPLVAGASGIVSKYAAASGYGLPNTIVHVANLPYSTTDADLVALAGAVRPIVHAEIQRLGDGRPAGTGAVEFHSVHDATAAVEYLNAHVYGSLSLVVTFARFPPGQE